MKRIIVLCFIFAGLAAFGQDKKIDQLEVLYDQGYYHKVLRKSEKLLARPEYDYSGLPSFYNSLALFRMSAEDTWFDRHDFAIDRAISSYDEFMDSERIVDYIAAHYHEIASLKTYLVDLETQFKSRGLKGTAEKIQNFRLKQLDGIKARPDMVPKINIPVKTNKKEKEVADEEQKSNSNRDEMVVFAKSLVGTKYKWAGTDTKGFDCSGLVSYVYKKYGIILPRTASAQLAGSKKVKIEDAQKGDLIFFSSGSTISHVGLVISEKGAPLVMVHASTSRGVIVTEIEKSTYWKPRLKAAGTFLTM